jgi:Glycosyl hydrolase family 65, N-terminal domain
VAVSRGFTLAREQETESLFAIGNGYIGNRGSLAEGSALSSPATFVAGVFEQADAPGSVPQLMVLPDWTGVRIWIDRQPLSMQRGEVLEHRRAAECSGASGATVILKDASPGLWHPPGVTRRQAPAPAFCHACSRKLQFSDLF